MTDLIVALPMYDWPEVRTETDQSWTRLRDELCARGIAAPERLARRNGDLPPVPGGIRDASGRVIAPDPATLPPEEFHLSVLWRHPALLLAQTCWGPMEEGLASEVAVVGQPCYSAYEGGEGGFYSSAILARSPLPSPLCGVRSDGRRPAKSRSMALGASNARSHAEGLGSVRSDGVGVGDVEDLPPPRSASPTGPPHRGEGKGLRLAFNSTDSMSGFIAPSRDLEARGETLGIFSEQIETGSHRASIVAVAEDRADICAVDCRTWDLAKRFEPRAAELQVIGWTAKRLGLPFITSRHTPPAVVQALREALQAFNKRASSG